MPMSTTDSSATHPTRVTCRRSRDWRRGLRPCSATADSCGFYFYCGVVFLYSHFQPIPRLRITNRSPARTATKPVRVRTAISSETGAESGRAFRSVE